MKRKAPPDLPKMRALLVECDPVRADRLSSFLLGQGFDHVEIATTDYAALQYSKYLRPNLLIMADGSSNIHCLELYGQLRSVDGYDQVPTLVFSNQSSDIEMHNLEKMADYGLPLTSDLLLTTIKQLLPS